MRSIESPNDGKFHRIDQAIEQAWHDASDRMPPMALDSAILTRAREEVAAPERRRGFLPRTWFTPLATASVLAIVVGLSATTFNELQTPELSPDVSESAIVAPFAESSSAVRAEPRAPASTAVTVANVADNNSLAQSPEGEQTLSDSTRQYQPVSPRAVNSGHEGAATASSGPTRLARTEMAVRVESESKVYTQSSLKRRARTDNKSAMAEEDFLDPVISRINTARNSDGSFSDTRLEALFENHADWFDSLTHLVAEGHIELASTLGQKFVDFYPGVEMPDHLAELVYPR